MDLKLKQNGLRFLDSRDGDLLIADPRLKMQLLFTVEFLDKAKSDPQKAIVLAQRLFDFLDRHEQARWNYVLDQVNEIKLYDLKFAEKIHSLMPIRSIDGLRKCEKEIYFFKNPRHEVDQSNN